MRGKLCVKYLGIAALALALTAVACGVGFAYAAIVLGPVETASVVSTLPIETYFESGGLAPMPNLEPVTWFDSNDLQCSPLDTELEYTVDSETVTVKVFIDETEVGCKDGRKNIIATFRYSSLGGADSVWCSALDRYTGVSFSSNPFSFDDALRFMLDDKPVGVFVSKTPETYFAGQYTQQVVVNCPKDYDGVVFQFAPVYGESDMQFDNSELHTLDSFSTWGRQLFFSKSVNRYIVQTLDCSDDMIALSLCFSEAVKAVSQ